MAFCKIDKSLAECVERGAGDRRTLQAIDSWPLEHGAYFWGHTPGNGKTLAMAHLCLRHLRAGETPLWERTHGILRRIRDSFDNRMSSEQGIMGRYMDAAVLMLDDIAVAGTDHERRVLYEILEERDAYGKVTCATGNCSLAELSQRMDARVASRLSERARPFEITDRHDYRSDRWRKQH